MGQYDKLPLDLLCEEVVKNKYISVVSDGEKLIASLNSFGIQADLVDMKCLALCNAYDIKLKKGTKVSKLKRIKTDLEVSLNKIISYDIGTAPGVLTIRIHDTERPLIKLKSLLMQKDPALNTMTIPIAAGVKDNGENLYFDLAKTPHLLISGSTGTGKSIFLHDIILSTLYSCEPASIQLILIDIKDTEFYLYEGIRRYPVRVITDAQQAIDMLQFAESVMRNRYNAFFEAGVRNIDEYNEKYPSEKLSRILIIVDEYYELVYHMSDVLEELMGSLARMSRAAGFSIILATQRPESSVLSGSIKMNLPARVTFSVSNWHESMMMLGPTGAGRLLGNGDMYYRASGSSKLIHAQAPYVTEEEIRKVAEYLAL